MTRIFASFVSLFVLCVMTSDVPGQDATAASRKKVLVIGIDGCRHDAVLTAKTPVIDALVARGTRFEGTDILAPNRTDSANTISGPGWSNLLTGVWPDKHGVSDNKFEGSNYKRFPHFFSLAKSAKPNIQTASFSDWGPIAEKILSDADHTVNKPASGADAYQQYDLELTEACCQHLKNHDPDLVFLYLGQVDETGHAFGFHPTVPQYIGAIERIDLQIGQVLKAIESRSTFAAENWLVIICTDHGGAGTDHGDGHSNPDIRRTFLVVSGPSAQIDATQIETYQVDVVATALTHLEIPLSKDWELDGKAVGLKTTNTSPSLP